MFTGKRNRVTQKLDNPHLFVGSSRGFFLLGYRSAEWAVVSDIAGVAPLLRRSVALCLRLP